MTDPPELHRPLALDRLGRGLDFAVSADAEECAAVARRMRIPGVQALSCQFHLRPELAGRIAATGALRARVTQTCVVSLEAFDADIAEDFAVVFVPEGEQTEDWDDPETIDEIPYAGAQIDLGEAAVEQLALAMEPYPRKPGAVVEQAGETALPGALAALARWKPPE
jgi:uncharacterized metal-binding protein YceD (DUF177 family)